MLVPRIERQIVLQGLRGDPHVVCGDWSSLLSERVENLRVEFRRLFIQQKDRGIRTQQELIELAFVLATPGTAGEASSQFSEDNHG